jgi:DNA-binding NarL/FixJ family response regulator
MDGAGDTRATTVVVAEDHTRFRQGLVQLLGEAPDIEVVGDAPDGVSAVRLADERKPDVVLMDVQMPLMDGIDATAEIAKRPEAPAVIVLTASSTSGDVLDAIAAGAAGYLLKGASAEEIYDAVRAVRAGRSPLSPEVTGTLLGHLREQKTAAPSGHELPDLSEREIKVLELLALGRDNAEIASELFLSPATVKGNVSALFAKLGVRSRAQAAVLAVRAGLI